MPLTIGNPRDLALAQLGELLWIERTLAGEVIPSLLGEVKDSELVELLREHLEQTKEHAVNVERALRALDSEASANGSPPLEGLRREHELLASNIKAEDLRDLFDAGAVARTEQLEIAAYRNAIGLAEALGNGEAVDALRRNLKDEERALAVAQKIAGRLATAAV